MPGDADQSLEINSLSPLKKVEDGNETLMDGSAFSTTGSSSPLRADLNGAGSTLVSPQRWVKSEWKYEKLVSEVNELSPQDLKQEIKRALARYVDQRPDHLRPRAEHHETLAGVGRFSTTGNVGAGMSSLEATAARLLERKEAGTSKLSTAESTSASQIDSFKAAEKIVCNICQSRLHSPPIYSCVGYLSAPIAGEATDDENAEDEGIAATGSLSAVEKQHSISEQILQAVSPTRKGPSPGFESESAKEEFPILIVQSNGNVMVRQTKEGKAKCFRHHFCSSCYQDAIVTSLAKLGCPLCERPVSRDRDLVTEMVCCSLDTKEGEYM